MVLRMVFFFVLLVSIGVSVSRIGEASKILVFDFTGKEAPAIRDKVVKGLINSGCSITPRKKARLSARQLGYKKLPSSNEERLKVASYLNVDGFVTGNLKIKGKRRSLRLEVIVVCEGGRIRPLDFEWVGKRVPQDTVSLIVSQIMNQIDRGVNECRALAHPPPAYGGVSQPSTGAGMEMEGEVRVEKPAGKFCKFGGIRCGKPYAVAFDIGFIVSSRQLVVKTVDAGPIHQYRYDGSAFPLFGMELFAYPDRFFRKSPRISFGLSFSFAHSFALVSSPLGAGGNDIPTRDMRVSITPGVSIAPVAGKIPLYILFGIGWGMHNYLIEFKEGEERYISDFKYRFVPIEIGIYADIIKRYLSADFYGVMKIPYKIGGAQSFYGDKAMKKFGWALRFDLSGIAAYNVFWKLGFEWSGFKADFSGEGDVANSLCNGTRCPSGKDFHDTYKSGFFMIGYKI